MCQFNVKGFSEVSNPKRKIDVGKVSLGVGDGKDIGLKKQV